MLETSARLLRLLTLLQTRKEWSGARPRATARGHARTVRRDVDKLRDLGYPVNATVGVGGGYQLGAGARDAAAAARRRRGARGGVRAAIRRDGAGDRASATPSLRALTKLRQVMPSRLRHRLDALRVDVVAAAAGDVGGRREAARHGRGGLPRARAAALRLPRPRRRTDRAARSSRTGWCARARAGTWSAWDLSREDWRSFRVDRMTPKIPTGPRFTPRELPEGGAAAFVARASAGPLPRPGAGAAARPDRADRADGARRLGHAGGSATRTAAWSHSAPGR